MTTYEYLQKVISTNGCTFEGCVYYAKQCASKLVPILARTHGTRAKRVLRNMLFTVMASDEYLTFTERKFIAEVLGWEVVEDLGDSCGLANYNTTSTRNMYKQIIMGYDVKTQDIFLGFLSMGIVCDGRFNYSDASILKHLMSFVS